MNRTDNQSGGVSPAMREQVLAELQRLETAEDVRVLYACESGSRAWGFASRDSDYDVRFVYVHRPDWYLSIRSRRDVIERPITGELDLAGWDIVKALQLFGKCNPTLMEWLDSPIVYIERGPFADCLRDLRSRFFSPIAVMHHYLRMAEGNFRAYFGKPIVRRKKYLYVLRPVLACEWIRQERGPVPTAMATMLAELLPDGPTREAVDLLLASKAAGTEMDDQPADSVLDAWLQERLSEFSTLAGSLPPAEGRNLDLLDSLLRQTIGETASEPSE